MLADFTGILVILLVGIGVVAAMLGVHLLLGPRRKFPEKNEPFECGESPIVSPHQRFAVKFYLVAILFVIFDVEVVFLYPWAVKFLRLELFALIEMGVFVLILLVGWAYAWRKRDLEWG